MMRAIEIWMIIIASGLVIGFAYGLDILQALEIPLRQEPYNFSTAEFNLAYFATFASVTIFQIPMGIIIGKAPLKLSLIILLLASLAAQIGISLAFQFLPPGYPAIVLCMRALFGIAGEGTFTVQALFLGRYFHKNYEFMLAIAVTLPFTFDSLNSILTTYVYDTTLNLPLTWYIGAAFCTLSLLAGTFLIGYMTKIDRLRLQARDRRLLQLQAQKHDSDESFPEQTEEQFSFKHFKQFSLPFWTMMISVFFFESSLAPFSDNLNELIVKRFNIPYVTAGQMLLVPMFCMVVFSAIVSLTIKRKPHWRRMSFVFGTTLYSFLFVILDCTKNTKSPSIFHYFLIVLFLLSMSLCWAISYGGLLTAMAYVVQERALGAAWGVCGCMIGFAQCIIPVFNIFFIDSDPDLSLAYHNLTFFGLMLSFIPLGLAYYMKFSSKYDILDTKLTHTASPTEATSKEPVVPSMEQIK